MKQKNSTLKRILNQPEMLTLAALMLLLLFNLFFTKNFFTIEIRDGHLYGSLIDIIKRGTPLMIMVLGLTLVISTGGTDISVGSIAAITGMTVASLLGNEFVFDASAEAQAQTHMALALLAGLLVAVLCGSWNGLLVAKIGVPPLIATLMLQVAGRGVAELIGSGRILTIYYKPFHYIGSGWLMGLPFSIFIVLTCGILMWLLVRKTALGLYLVSTGSNKTVTRFAGINTQAVIWFAYILCGAMAGIAGIITTSEIKAADPVSLGLYLELDAILACNIGGNSMKGGKLRLGGSILGALLVQTLTTTIYSQGVPSETILVYKALAVIIVGVIQVADWSKSPFAKKKAEGGES